MSNDTKARSARAKAQYKVGGKFARASDGEVSRALAHIEDQQALLLREMTVGRRDELKRVASLALEQHARTHAATSATVLWLAAGACFFAAADVALAVWAHWTELSRLL